MSTIGESDEDVLKWQQTQGIAETTDPVAADPVPEPYKPLRWPSIQEFYSNRNRRLAEEALANKEYDIDDSALQPLAVPGSSK